MEQSQSTHLEAYGGFNLVLPSGFVFFKRVWLMLPEFLGYNGFSGWLLEKQSEIKTAHEQETSDETAIME